MWGLSEGWRGGWRVGLGVDVRGREVSRAFESRRRSQTGNRRFYQVGGLEKPNKTTRERLWRHHRLLQGGNGGSDERRRTDMKRAD
jgi:hypothetical protein